MFIHCCDFSPVAIELVKVTGCILLMKVRIIVSVPPFQKHPMYNARRCSAFVHDIAGEERIPLPPHSLDYITLFFVLSSLDQSKLDMKIVALATRV